MKRFKESLLFYTASLLFFILYFKPVQYAYNAWVPLNPGAQLSVIWVLFIVAAPLSVISAHFVLKFVKES